MKLNEYQKTIKKLFDDDQKDHSVLANGLEDKKRLLLIGKRDLERIRKLNLVLKDVKGLRGIDYFRAGVVFQHGSSMDHIRKAKKAAEKSLEMGYKPGKWLYAATTDRVLMLLGKKQKFGTQFMKLGRKWVLYPVEEKTTDAQRRKYNVVPLRKIEKIANSISSKSQKKVGLTMLS